MHPEMTSRAIDITLGLHVHRIDRNERPSISSWAPDYLSKQLTLALLTLEKCVS